MTGSASKRWTLRVTCDSLLRERVQGEGWCPIGPDGRLADDGKRFHAVNVLFSCESFLRMGGGLGEGVGPIAPDRRLADDGKRFDALDVA